MSNKILFIVKSSKKTNKTFNTGLTNGLYNSAYFLNEMLCKNNINSNLTIVKNSKEIPEKIHEFNPTHVIIEALWIKPIYFSDLCDAYPKIKWVVRIHSEIPFLSTEGIAMDWIFEYLNNSNAFIATNGNKIFEDIKLIVGLKFNFGDIINERILYLPNYYPNHFKYSFFNREKDTIDIGCFGAVRPMKNHLLQAIAAIKFAKKINKKLRFHINADILEMNGEPVLKNLIGLFSNLDDTKYTLINDQWMPRNEFLTLCSSIDIGMQVSFSETFNIVAADFISQGTPIVTSLELPWVTNIFSTSSTSVNKIYLKLLLTYYFPYVNFLINSKLLHIYINKSKNIWLKKFK